MIATTASRKNQSDTEMIKFLDLRLRCFDRGLSDACLRVLWRMRTGGRASCDSSPVGSCPQSGQCPRSSGRGFALNREPQRVQWYQAPDGSLTAFC
ncbi:MAG: hypothetical protein EAZ65_03950 [Verrucomicrobia bacterium]|nr:MAG: hypothetical protein EAZ82_04630 [Verrucomicrobiota bacterium]TAF26979.1 MAG: hypothetical protein EAZ71_03945 [Verrucomicrobiota bacterium]TAF42235.1 MAG: hypothetical protein EAZ65_03950 [Verrucomicrobiota bacterium]